ncbi:MAG: phosphoglycerate kinase, partial [Halobacteriota archaeon]
MGVRTLDEVTVADRAIGVRVDVNSPIADDGTIADDARFAAHRSTLAELLEGGGRVVVLAHQGRPGGDAFTTLEEHAARLGELVGREVTYLDSIFGAEARDAIDGLDAGAALCLENVRFYSEEYMELDPARAARTHLIDRLSEPLDVFVNDAFACAHRSQAT